MSLHKKSARLSAALLYLLFSLLIFSHLTPSVDAAERDEKWAEPIALAGVLNLHKIDNNLYRSAQPSAEGMKNLEAMGIRTVLNLRTYNSDRSETKGTKLREVRVQMHAWDPQFDEIATALRVLIDPSGAPNLVHCQHGADRTGMTVAMYRMVVQNWPREEAIREMLDGDYGFHIIWTGIVRFLETVDIEAMRRAVGIA
ncbi:tyrosine-protein phosphatase [Synergistaceae bacterium OttesenSCG-928-I11]|nr:tyrosine-protein phosphatase [Synergistaceae bacterium OttesenSCG-928-I11]